jgi:hypothetical protein
LQSIQLKDIADIRFTMVRAVPIDELNEFDPGNGLRAEVDLNARSHTNLLDNPTAFPEFFFAQKIQPIYRSLRVQACL